MENKTMETVEKDAALQEAFAEIKRTVESQNTAQAELAAKKEAVEVKAASGAGDIDPPATVGKKAGEEPAGQAGKAEEKTAAKAEKADSGKASAKTASKAEVKKPASKASVSKLAEKKEEEKKASARKAPVRKASAKKAEEKAPVASSGSKAAAKAKDSVPESTVILEYYQRKVNLEEIRAKALEAARRAKPNVATVEIYVVAEQNAAYYVVDGEGKAEYKIDL